MSGDLSAWISDRYDEAQALAEAADPGPWEVGPKFGARDPEHRLRDIALKRAILTWHAPLPFWGNMPPRRRDRTLENAVSWYCDCQSEDGAITAEYPCETVRHLGTEFSDRPDYPHAWKPAEAA